MTDFLAEWGNTAPFVEARTSGSTGTPKAIRLPKADMRQSARATNAFFVIGPHSVLASPLSFDYIAGKMMAVRACEAGCRLIELPVSNTIILPDGEQAIDLLPIVPSQLQSLIDKPEYAARIRNVLIGGAAPSADSCDALLAAGYKTYISYGMTETCSHVALADAAERSRTFHAMPGILFDTDSDSRLIIGAPAFSFARLQTNDVVELLSPSTFRWRGRADGAINSGGIKLFPEELEQLYAPALSGQSYYVCAEQHSRWGQSVMLVIEGRDIDTDAIAARLRTIVADHRRLPKRIAAVAALPRTVNGKIRRIPAGTRNAEFAGDER